MLVALTQWQGNLIIAAVAAIVPLGSAYLAIRASRQTTKLSVSQQATSDLIDDLREDRDSVRKEVRDLRAEVVELRLEIDKCHQERDEEREQNKALTRRIAELERAS